MLKFLLSLVLTGSIIAAADLKPPKSELATPCLTTKTQLNIAQIEDKARRYGELNELAFTVTRCYAHAENEADKVSCNQARTDLCYATRMIDQENQPGFIPISDDDISDLRSLCGLKAEEH